MSLVTLYVRFSHNGRLGWEKDGGVAAAVLLLQDEEVLHPQDHPVPPAVASHVPEDISKVKKNFINFY